MIDFYRHEVAPYLAWLGGWSYLILLVFVLIEGPIATILGASAASVGLLEPWLVFVSCAAGNLLGDLMWYSVGRTVPRPWLLRAGRWVGLRQDVIDFLEKRIRENAARIVLGAKLTWLMAQQTFIVLGMARVAVRRWLWLNVAAEILWTGMLVSSGYWLVHWISTLQHGMQWATFMLYVLLIFGLVRFVRRFSAGQRLPASKDQPPHPHAAGAVTEC